MCGYGGDGGKGVKCGGGGRNGDRGEGGEREKDYDLHFPLRRKRLSGVYNAFLFRYRGG